MKSRIQLQFFCDKTKICDLLVATITKEKTDFASIKAKIWRPNLRPKKKTYGEDTKNLPIAHTRARTPEQGRVDFLSQ